MPSQWQLGEPTDVTLMGSASRRQISHGTVMCSCAKIFSKPSTAGLTISIYANQRSTGTSRVRPRLARRTLLLLIYQFVHLAQRLRLYSSSFAFCRAVSDLMFTRWQLQRGKLAVSAGQLPLLAIAFTACA